MDPSLGLMLEEPNLMPRASLLITDELESRG
jgi:hypothetical protein